jgi:predicted hydrocarbon binding protein
MASAASILSPLGLDRIVDARGLARDPATGTLEQAGARVVGAPGELLHSLRFVLEKDFPGAGTTVFKASGVATGKAIGGQLDAALSRQGKPVLSALPLDACLALLEEQLAAEGWGRVSLDLGDAAEHGFMVARLEQSVLVDALAEVDDFVDALLAGILAGFFQHISGEPLDCEEIACVRRGAPECVFVITAAERLAPLIARRAHEAAPAIIASLKT